MTNYRDFDAMVASTGRPSFTVGGQKYEARSKLPWHTYNAITAAAAEAESQDEREFTLKFFNTVLLKDDRKRFTKALTADPENVDDADVIGVNQLNDLMEWLMEHYTGKLQASASSTSNGLALTGEVLS